VPAVALAAEHAVLKVSPPEDDEADHEADALAAWNGDGAVRLLRHDRARRAMLIERAVPGYDATQIPDDEALTVAMEVGRRLWRPVESGPFRRAHCAEPGPRTTFDCSDRWRRPAARL